MSKPITSFICEAVTRARQVDWEHWVNLYAARDGSSYFLSKPAADQRHADYLADNIIEGVPEVHRVGLFHIPAATAEPPETPMPNLADQELRLECVKIASCYGDPASVVKLAEQFHAFITGASDPSPRQLINEALDKANVS